VTKRGLIALTETLATELGGDNIRVNAIAPGAVEGERIRRGQVDLRPDDRDRRQLVRRLLTRTADR
jgi:NAD(P)-dependent dehydrogenase (short-subunit alcohol dehydrogenase family)